jgi:hypothetical protein
MADAATLIVLVAAAEATDPTTHAMARATKDALGPAARVVVRETPGDPGDAEAIAAERAENADAVVELSWIASREGRHRQASVRMHLRNSGRWVDRWITFRPTDADAERGRTLGFAIASILPEAATPGSPSSPSPASTVGTTTPTPPAPDGAAPETAPAPTPPPPPPPSAPPPPTASPAPPPPPSSSTSPAPPVRPENPPGEPDEKPPLVTVEGLVAVFGADAFGGAGGGVAGEYFVLPYLSVRLGGSLRQGTEQVHPTPDNLDFTVWSIAGGVVYHPVRARLRERVGFSVRADFLFDIVCVSRPPDVSSESHCPFTYGPELGADLGVLIVPNVEVVLGGGGQIWLRPISVNDGHDGHLQAQYRGFGEAGIRLRF